VLPNWYLEIILIFVAKSTWFLIIDSSLYGGSYKVRFAIAGNGL